MNPTNPFFKRKKPILLSKIINVIKSKNIKVKKIYVNDIKEINGAKKMKLLFCIH